MQDESNNDMNRGFTDTIMMIRPKHFGYNEETASNNSFQSSEGKNEVEKIKAAAISEFDTFVEVLEQHNVKIEIVDDRDTPALPDVVFPNNWISFHQEGWIITYPMWSSLRRKERREDIIDSFTEKFNFRRRYSFEHYEEEGKILEGTGSLVLDREHKIAYACVSPRTDLGMLDKWCILTGYKACSFHAYDRNSSPIYHTNVMMAIGPNYAVVCSECIEDEEERNDFLKRLSDSGKDIIELTYDQVEQFAGNMLALHSDRPLLVMSESAYQSLREEQISKLSEHASIIYSDIETIEKYGGGSVRCMMAEVFLP